MTTDDERRRVAARLRSWRERVGDFYTLSLAIEAESCLASDIADRLADLIEPSEPEGTCGNCKHFIKDRFMPCAAAHGYTEADVSACEDFSPLSCDREALLALAEDVEEAAAMTTVMDASKGSKLLAGLLLDIARRIREACGEVDA